LLSNTSEKIGDMTEISESFAVDAAGQHLALVFLRHGQYAFLTEVWDSCLIFGGSHASTF
jgi:hypothetical protein